MTSVRAARSDPAERARLEDICVRTGAAGADATALLRDPRLLTDVYLSAYLALEPELCLVLTDDHDRPVGYAVGTADTAAFERRCDAQWWPGARDRHPPRDVVGISALEAHLLDRLTSPQPTDPAILERFPAHLHIDLLPRAQGGGNGRLLITALLGALKDAGAAGVHLGVDPTNQRALGFYRHLGFAELPVAQGLVLGLRL